MQTMPNGLPRFFADRVRHNNYELRNSNEYEIIDRRLGFNFPVCRIVGVSAMESRLKALNDAP